MSSTLVIVPTYNEAASIRTLVGRVRDAVPDADVLIVDDASPDGTGAIADELAAADRRIMVLHRSATSCSQPAPVAGFCAVAVLSAAAAPVSTGATRSVQVTGRGSVKLTVREAFSQRRAVVSGSWSGAAWGPAVCAAPGAASSGAAGSLCWPGTHAAYMPPTSRPTAMPTPAHRPRLRSRPGGAPSGPDSIRDTSDPPQDSYHLAI